MGRFLCYSPGKALEVSKREDFMIRFSEKYKLNCELGYFTFLGYEPLLSRFHTNRHLGL